MDVLVIGRRCPISDDFRDRVTNRLGTIARLNGRVIRIEVLVSANNCTRAPDQAVKVEITLRSNGPVVRAEATADDKVIAFEHALDRLKSRLRRAGDRRKDHRGLRTPSALAEVMELPSPGVTEDVPTIKAPAIRKIAGLEVTGDGPLVVREKVFTAAPLTLSQALDEMEMVGHDFFLYVDAETGQPSVVYRRKAYDYGVLHLQVVTEDAD